MKTGLEKLCEEIRKVGGKPSYVDINPHWLKVYPELYEKLGDRLVIIPAK